MKARHKVLGSLAGFALMALTGVASASSHREAPAIGFDPAATRSTAYGLVGMRFRVAAEQGTLTVVSMPGHGTSIQVSLPEASKTEPATAA